MRILCCRSHSLACFLSSSVTTNYLVEEYEQHRQHFMTSATVSQFIQLFPATATSSKLSSEKVSFTLKLENDWGSDTLQDLTMLVNKFGVSNVLICKFEGRLL